MTRGAYVELNFFHGEIQPTFWWIAREIGLDLDFHVLAPNAALDPLGLVPDPPAVVPIEVPDPHDPCPDLAAHLDRLAAERYDVIVLGTADPADRPAALARLDVPQLHLVHNVDRAPRPRRGVTPCVLAPHALPHVDPDAVLVEPFYTGAATTAVPDRPLVVSVPGNIQLERRNYGSLIRALRTLRDEGVTPDDLVVPLLGRAYGKEPHLQGRVRYDGARLLDACEAAGVAGFVDVLPAELSYPDLARAVARSHHVLPLIDDCFFAARPYLHGKHTGAIGVGIGGGAVPILNERHAAALGIDAGPRYRLDDVASGLRTALAGRTHVADRAAIATFRQARLAASAASFGSWLGRVS